MRVVTGGDSACIDTSGSMAAPNVTTWTSTPRRSVSVALPGTNYGAIAACTATTTTGVSAVTAAPLRRRLLVPRRSPFGRPPLTQACARGVGRKLGGTRSCGA